VWKARHEPSGRDVAVKTFRDQSIREVGVEALDKRFAREVSVFKTLGVAPGPDAGKKAIKVFEEGQLDPAELFVNLLDFSGGDDGGASSHHGDPGRAADGRCYTVLELADCSLDEWVAERSASPEAGRAELYDVAGALARSLAWLHGHDLCHNDVKPSNIMRFGTRWKLIDLEGVLPLGGPAEVHTSCTTPLYVCPELARAVLKELGASGSMPSVIKGMQPTPKMDLWAAGVVLLDVLARGCAFEEAYSGFRTQAMMNYDGGDDACDGLQEWYEWLADPAPIDPGEYASPPEFCPRQLSSAPPCGAELSQLLSLFCGLLAKDPGQRFSSDEFLSHPAVASDEEADNAKAAACQCFSFRWPKKRKT